VGLVFFDRVLMPRIVRLGDEVEVPEVVLMEGEEAQRLLEERGLGFLVVAERHDPQVPAGHVLEQIPDPGMRVKRGRKIRVLLSLGPEGSRMPDVRGEPLNHARLLLQRQGLGTGRVLYVPSRELPEGTVLASSPAPGAPLAGRPPVALVVSSGPPEARYVMPELRGRLASETVEMLRARGLRVELRPWPGQPPGGDVIVEQTPPAGYAIAAGGTVELLTAQRNPWR
jgi:serine/threonine-protein kinase